MATNKQFISQVEGVQQFDTQGQPKYKNKIFAESTLKDPANPNTSMMSQMRLDRTYLLSKHIAEELNTYVSFDPFPTFNDFFAPDIQERTNKNGKKEYYDAQTGGSGTPGVRSLFNKSGAVIVGDKNATTDKIVSKCASEFRIMNNVPLMDNPATRRAINDNSKCTVKDLVEASQQGLLGRATYSYADFMYCKYLGRVSNNYMITLRRFPYPVDDFVSSLGIGMTRADEDFQSKNADSIGCMITWLGTPGNDMANILKYSVAMPFKEQKASMQDSKIDADSGGGFANSIAAAFDPVYREQMYNGQAGTAMNKLFGKFAGFKGDPPYPASQWNSMYDQTKVYGPIDVIKTTYTRSEDGLDFQQNIQLVFDYELRSYNGINPRQAMLDLISNILHVTYNTGTFWGGGFRGGGAHQSNIFTNLAIYTKGAQGRGLAGFIDSFAEDYSTLSKNAKDSVDKNGGLIETLKKLANTLGGMLISGLLNQLGRPHKQMANSILSPAPVGFWHLTVGNPHHPIMSIGNLILKTATIQHYGPLGIDDFPTGLKVTCDLIRGKSRDIRDIEKLYMHGNDRIYTSMSKKVLDMYAHSKEYREAVGKVDGVASYVDGNVDTDAVAGSKTIDAGVMKGILLKYFGNSDVKSILVPAMEQEHGYEKKKKKETAGEGKPKKKVKIPDVKFASTQEAEKYLRYMAGDLNEVPKMTHISEKALIKYKKEMDESTKKYFGQTLNKWGRLEKSEKNIAYILANEEYTGTSKADRTNYMTAIHAVFDNQSNQRMAADMKIDYYRKFYEQKMKGVKEWKWV